MLKWKLVRKDYLETIENNNKLLSEENVLLKTQIEKTTLDNRDLTIKIEKVYKEIDKMKNGANAAMKKWLRGYPNEEEV